MLVLISGGHTGSIQAKGGSGDIRGGSGSGGRIAIYHTSNVTHNFYQGNFKVHGGPVGSSAEAGASGTVFLKHIHMDHTTLMVDNNNRRPVATEIENIGQRLDLTNHPSTYSKSKTFTSASGIRVQSSQSVYNLPYDPPRSIPNDAYSYFIPYLFDQTFRDDIHHYFMVQATSASLVISLQQTYFINTIRVHPICSYPTKFKVSMLKVVWQGKKLYAFLQTVWLNQI